MMKRNLTLIGAAVASAVLTASAVAQTQSYDSGARGVVTPHSVSEAPSIRSNVPAGQPTMPTVNDPMSPSESRPSVQAPEGVRMPAAVGIDTSRRVPEAGSGLPTMPSRNNPASVSESAPQMTGKEVSSVRVPDDKTMPNLKAPASVSESAPARTGQELMGVGGTR